MTGAKPQIRFKGFTDVWEQRKLGDSVNFINGRAYKQSELLDEGKYRVLRVGNFNTNDKWYYSNLEIEPAKYAEDGDLLYLWATNFGPEIWNEEKVIYHYHIWKIDIKDKNIDKLYLYVWLGTDKERIKRNTNGSTMVHVTKSNMEKHEFQFPSYSEQTKIGNLFQNLDNLIDLHQRKLELSKKIKKVLLKNVFDQSYRFGDFDDEWKQHELSEITKISKGHQRGKLEISTVQSEQNPYPVYNGGQGVSGFTDEFNRENKVMVSEGGASAGFVNYYEGKYWSGGHNFTIDNLDNALHFIKAILEFNQNHIYELKVGSGLPNIQLGSIQQFKIIVPQSIQEQEIIGNLFQNIDNLIDLNQSKLVELKQIKKTLLQKMFI